MIFLQGRPDFYRRDRQGRGRDLFNFFEKNLSV